MISFFKRITPTGLIVLWVLTRLWALGCGMKVLPYPTGEYLFSDVQLYDWWSSNIADGHFPINDPMWQYPPLAALVFYVGYCLHSATIGFVVLALIADGLTLGVLIRASKRQQLGHYLPAAIWLLAPLVMGPIILGRFDVFPTLLMVVALLASQQPVRAGFWLAIGTLLKVWPILGLLALKRSALPKAMISFIATSVAGSLLLKLWWPGSFSFIDGQKSRGLQIESVGALPYMWWNATSHIVTTDFRFGAIEVVARGTSVVSFAITLCTIVLLGRISIWRLQGRFENVSAPDVALVTVLIAMVTSRVLSPQYNVWIFGILAVCAVNPGQHFERITQLFFIGALAGQFLYPFAYVSFQSGEVLPTIAQTIRIGTLLAATYLAWQQIKPRPAHLDRDHPATPGVAQLTVPKSSYSAPKHDQQGRIARIIAGH